MKLLHILSELNPSGAETMLLCAAPFLQEQGIHSDILATAASPGVFAPTLANAGYKIQHIPFRKHPQFFIDLYRLLKTEHYDSVHMHSEQGGFWVTLVVLLAGIPAKRCIHTKHNTFSFTGLLRWNRAWQRQLLSFLGVPHVAISQSVQDTERDRFKIKTQIIQNWYDSQRFTKTNPQQYAAARASLELAENDFVLLSVGNCSAVKNHRALLTAIAALNNPAVIYLHIGIEADQSEQQQAEALGIKPQIRFLGMQKNILPFLQAADLYVMPSTFEGFGIAAIEAIATEIPALLSRVPGLNDFADLFKGIYYAEPDAASLQAALKTIINTPKAQLQQATANNSATAEQLFGIRRGISAYITLYRGS
jgi:glycosyltransferase involved in cell wall biosynthesis